MKRFYTVLAVLVSFAFSGLAQATTFTKTSPASGLVPAGISEVGGIVLDLTGTNNVRVVSQLAASSLFVGFYDDGTPSAFNGNPGTIGIQTGFGSAITGALGGGLQKAGIRFTLYDGDSASGNFDSGDNTLLVNGLTFGNWSNVITENTDGLGNAGGAGFSNGGFRNNILDTGWFYNTDAALLASLFSTFSTGEVKYQVSDTDPYDNFYDFTQGLDASLINVGTGPTITPNPGAVPEPSTFLLLGAGIAGVALLRRKKTTA